MNLFLISSHAAFELDQMLEMREVLQVYELVVGDFNIIEIFVLF